MTRREAFHLHLPNMSSGLSQSSQIMSQVQQSGYALCASHTAVVLN